MFPVFSVMRWRLFLAPYRWGIPQLPPLFPLWLCNQRVWLQVEPYHLFHRPHVLLGPGDGPQESVPRAGPGPNTAHRRRKPPEWLRLLNRGQLQGKTTEKKKLHSPLTAIHFSSSEDKSQLREGLDHILLVFVVFVAVPKQNCSRWITNTFC